MVTSPKNAGSLATTTTVMEMRLNRTWEIKLPPAKKRVIAGTLLPTVKGFGGRFLIQTKKRRLTLEIHGPIPVDDDEDSSMDPPELCDTNNSPQGRRGGLTRETGALSSIHLSKELMDDDRIYIRIFKPRKQWGFSRDSDDSSDSEDDDDDPKATTHNTNNDGWVEYRKYGLDEIFDEELHNTVFEATMGLGASQERREIRFENDQQVKEFMDEFQALKALVKERAHSRLMAFQESQAKTQASIQQIKRSINQSSQGGSMSDLTASSEIELLIELASATDLPIADRKSTDPYVIVYMGKQEVHRTRSISRTLNPIWTVDTASLFLLRTSAEEFFEATAGLTFLVKDYDGISKNDVLCKVNVEQAALLQMNGERVALPLTIVKAHKYKLASTHFHPVLYLRVRPATPGDRTFMKRVFAVAKKKTLGIYAEKTFVGPQRDRVKLLKRESKQNADGIKLHRVKPRPDPTRPEQDSKWLDNNDLLIETMKHSYKWVEAGTGSLGKLYLEVLKCEGLPNMDSKMDGQTDAFCCIIYEDAITNTDVINDTLKPRWMPWCQRAFCFRMAHPSSQVLIGVFDYDTDKGLNSHDAIGRVSIDITNFRRDTEYVLTYDLFRSVLVNQPRTANGTVTVRLRLEYDSYREFVKGSLQLPDANYINLPRKSGFKTSYFVTSGEENLERFDMDAITAYRTELEAYIGIGYWISQAVITVLLWRGHKKINVFGYKFKLPIHSAIAFLMGIALIDNFNLLPSFSLFTIAWLLLATNEQRQINPSPWYQTMTYLQLWHAVIANKAPAVVIDAHENESAIRTYEAEIKQRQEQEIIQARKARENAERINTFLSEEQNSAADAFEEDDTTKLGGRPQLNPLAHALLPIQKILGQICKSLRIISSIVLWNESIYAFIIVNTCLILGVALIWVPWSSLIRWTIRVAIWIFLGPWMKLVDIFYIQKMTMEQGQSETDMFKKLAEAKLKSVGAARDAMMQRREEITKVRAMKRFMFGRFVTRVPQLKEYRYPDRPRAESYAKPLATHPEIQADHRSHGQTLVGHMIPTWGDDVDAKKQQEVEKEDVKEEFT